MGPGLISLPSECKIPRDEKSDGTFCCALQLPMLIFLSKQLHTYFITTDGNYRLALTHQFYNMINENRILPVISLYMFCKSPKSQVNAEVNECSFMMGMALF